MKDTCLLFRCVVLNTIAEYKTDKLKEKLYKHFGDKIKFWHPNYRSDLVYSEEIPTGKVIEVAFESVSSDERLVMDVGPFFDMLS